MFARKSTNAHRRPRRQLSMSRETARRMLEARRMPPHVPRFDRLLHAARCSSMAGVLLGGRYALACSRTAQSWRARALTLSLRGMGAPATVGQPATALPCSHACHAHAPLAHDGAQRRFASGTPIDELATFLRGGVRSAWLQYVYELCWACLPTGLGCGIAREERERSTARPLTWCVSRTDERGRS